MYRFKKKQLQMLADLFKDLSLLFFGTVIVPFFNKIDNINYLMLVLGLVLSASFLIFSLYTLDKI